MLHIRTAEPQDYPEIVAIRNMVEHDQITVQEMLDDEELDRENPGVIRTRMVAVDPTGKRVGYVLAGHWNWLPEGRFSVFVAVHPEHRRRGYGRQLLQAGEHWAVEQGAKSFRAFCQGHDDASYQWAQHHGYVMERQGQESVLDLSTWDGGKFASQVEAVRASGISLIAVPDICDEGTFRSFHALMVETVPDIPSYEGEFGEYEYWIQEFRAEKNPRVIALALDAGRVVGVSYITFLPTVKGPEPYSDYTGTLRSHRGRGIALALKVLTIEAAAARGANQMRTDNDPDNPAMLAVNNKLGYRAVPGARDLKKYLG